MSYQLNELNSKSALITGASSGIGKATAYLLGESGVNLKLVARRTDPLIEIQKHFDGKIKVDILSCDLTSSDAISTMSQNSFFDVDICVNNAGAALGRDSIQNSNDDDWEKMINLNVLSSFKVVKNCLPFMEKNGGDIISISSIAAHDGYAGGSVYCASKAALRSFMQSLRKETYGNDIRAMMISPGMVDTEFSLVRFKGDKQAAKDVYTGTRSMTPMDIAEHVKYLLTRPRHINIEDMISLGTDQASAILVKRD